IGALPAEMPGSAALQAVLRKALARDRNLRYASAKEFAAALEEIERALPDPQAMPKMEQGMKPGVVIAIVAIIVLLGVGVIGAGVMLWPKLKERFTKPPAVAETTTQPATTTTVAPPPTKISEASVNVVTTTSEPPPTITTSIEEVTTTTQSPITLSTTTNPLQPPRTETAAPPPVKGRVDPRVEPPPPRDEEPPPVHSG